MQIMPSGNRYSRVERRVVFMICMPERVCARVCIPLSVEVQAQTRVEGDREMARLQTKTSFYPSSETLPDG